MPNGNTCECPKFEAELRERYEKLRQNYHEEQAKIASLSEAPTNLSLILA